METDTLVVGGGLAGLYLSYRLASAGHDFQLLEARDRLGGRIKGQSLEGLNAQAGQGFFDMGPAWFWPGQPRIARLLRDLGIEAFEQYAAGTLAFEDETGAVRRDLHFAPMAGSLRVSGGLARLIDTIAGRLPEKRVHLESEVVRVERSGAGSQSIINVCFRDSAGKEHSIRCNRVVLAIPPRLVGERIAFSPALPDKATAEMRGIYTWMAGHAKAMAVYEKPFWRDAGLSGDGMSHRGPLAEIHDASLDSVPGTVLEDSAALFGFFGIPASARRDLKAQGMLEVAVKNQLVRLFGDKAAYPKALWIKDWADDPFTAVQSDETPPPGHPMYGLPPTLRHLWEGSLILSSSEAAPEFGGFIEGALEAAEITLRSILAKSDKEAAVS